jgi:short-subunit dehydrogenase
MLTTYRDEIIIITGASSGIGAAFAKVLSDRGAKVVLFARRADKLNAVAATLTGDHIVVVGDITLPDDRAKLINAALKAYGRIGILINNAGRGGGGIAFAKQDPATIEQVIQTNLLGVMHLTRLVLPHMLERQRGIIINVSSPLGQFAVPKQNLYNVSKAGLTMFSDTLRRELLRTPIHVMDLRPGFTRSEIITPEAETRLPAFLPVKDTEETVIPALHAAAHGHTDCSTGGGLVWAGLWLNRALPRAFDFAFKQMTKSKWQRLNDK